MSCGPGPKNRQPRQPWLGDQKKFAQVAIFCAVFAFNGLGTKTDFQDQACGTVEAIFANNFWQHGWSNHKNIPHSLHYWYREASLIQLVHICSKKLIKHIMNNCRRTSTCHRSRLLPGLSRWLLLVCRLCCPCVVLWWWLVDNYDDSAGLCGGGVIVGFHYDDGDEEYQDDDDGGDVAPGLHAVLPLYDGGGGWLMIMMFLLACVVGVL